MNLKVFVLRYKNFLYSYIYRLSIIRNIFYFLTHIITELQYFLLNDITLFFYVKKRRKMFLLKNDYAIMVSWISIIYGYKEA